jgi:hypothetical protein
MWACNSSGRCVICRPALGASSKVGVSPLSRELCCDIGMLTNCCCCCCSSPAERAAIEEWLSRGNSKDPVTGEAYDTKK